MAHHMDASAYRIEGEENLHTPALVYYRDMILENTKRAIDMAGGADRLWPHIKTHKMREMIAMQMELGIQRFKCATILEARMLAEMGAPHILMAYPLVGPNIADFLSLAKAYPGCVFYAIGDSEPALAALSLASEREGMRTNVLLDINMGMDRTGVRPKEALALYETCADMPGLAMRGMHGYDGHANDKDPEARLGKSAYAIDAIQTMRQALVAKGIGCQMLVMGGTPSFPIHAAYEDVYLSPGTIFVLDARYMLDLTDLPMRPAAALVTRVISHPAPGLFTVDLGSKAISTDMEGRGLLLSVPNAHAVRHSEEHWVYEMENGAEPPQIGQVLYALPMHICTTTMLYPFVHVAAEGKIVGKWTLAARDRQQA